MKFSVTTSTSIKVTTIVISTLLLVSIIFCFYLFVTDGALISLIIALILLAIVVTAYAFSPQNYVVENNQLIIKRLIGSVVIPKSAIQDVTLISEDMIAGSLRTFGVGGLFGYFGKFSSSKMGIMTWYLKSMSKPVLIITSVEKILVSPDDTEGFIAAFN
jgi:hypothetical protein